MEIPESLKEKKEVAATVCCEVCKHYGMEQDALFRRKVTKRSAEAKSLALYILHNDIGLSAACLAFHFHITTRAVFYNCANMGAYIKTYKEYRQSYETIKGILGF